MKELRAPGSDEELVRLAARGDERAFRELYRRHARLVARTAHALVRNSNDVEDIVQGAFAEACLRVADLRNAADFGPWVRRIAVRDAYDLLRARRRGTLLLGAFATLSRRSEPPSERGLLSSLYDALDRMPVKLRVPWTLHVLDGATFEEVAALCDTGLNTAKRRVAEAQARIDRRLRA